MSMLKALRATAPEAPINIVNGDVQIVEMIQQGENASTRVITDTTPKGPHERVKFTPVDPSSVQLVATDPDVPYAPPRVRGNETPSDNLDLVGDVDAVEPAPKRNVRGGGRKRIYATNAERQKALRDRKRKQQAGG